MLLKKNEVQNHEVDRRTNLILIMIIIMFLILMLNYFNIQILSHNEKREKALNNTVRHVTIQQERGIVYDRSNNVIANNNIKFSISILPTRISNYGGNKEQRRSKVVEVLNYINSQTDVGLDVEEKATLIMSKPSFQKTKIYSSADYNRVALNLNKISYIAGVEIDTELVRNYPYDELFFHSLGYTSKPNSSEINNINIDKDSIVGRTGLEKFYNDKLQGELGLKKLRIGASGRVVEEEIVKVPVSGSDLKITIDKDLQELFNREFKDKRGVAVVLEVNSGDILGYYSAPSLDSNYFSKGISKEKMNEIMRDTRSPMLDRVINSTYSPASTIKPFIAFGALIGDFIDPYEDVFSAATYKVGDQIFREWQSWGHGDINMARSLSRSSNYYYYDLGFKMGVDYMHDTLAIFNFGEDIQIKEIDSIRNGINPSNNWKIKTYGERFYKGEEVMISIGSGLISASPMELAYAIKLIANGGKKYELKMNFNEGVNLIQDLKFKEDWVKPVREGLYDVVNTRDGTGRAVRQFTDVVVAGKTGTAQVFSSRDIANYENDDVDELLRNHSLFIGYAPYENPEIAFIVIGENQGGGSGFAAEVSGKLVETYLGRKGENNDE